MVLMYQINCFAEVLVYYLDATTFISQSCNLVSDVKLD